MFCLPLRLKLSRNNPPFDFSNLALSPTKIAIKSTTQEHLDIEDIRDDMVVLKDGSVDLILQTTAVNFGLLSETEQDALIYAYAGLLNSLSFPLQIVIRSRRMDISSYLELLKQAEGRQINENLRFQMKKYREFVEAMIRENNVLDKRFYIVIPFSSLELGAKSATGSLLKGGRGGLPYSKDYILQKAKVALYPKRDHLLKQLGRLGLKAKQLTTENLVELFYDIYNPASVGVQKLMVGPKDLTVPIIEPAIIK